LYENEPKIRRQIIKNHPGDIVYRPVYNQPYLNDAGQYTSRFFWEEPHKQQHSTNRYYHLIVLFSLSFRCNFTVFNTGWQFKKNTLLKIAVLEVVNPVNTLAGS